MNGLQKRNRIHYQVRGKKKLILFFIILLLTTGSHKVVIQTELPYDIPDNQMKSLRAMVDHSLELKLEKVIRQTPKWARLITRKKMAIGVVDLTDPLQPRFARIHGDVMMYAASLPKLAILLAAFQSFEDGTLGETPEIHDDLKIMISQSNNDAATRMIERIGFDKIESVLQNPKYALYDIRRGGGIWVGKKYKKESERHPDPLMHLSHGATVTQVCRFYYLLAMGKLVNRERSRQMLEILADPEIHSKFVYAFENIAPEAKLYRKSGTWKNWHSDSVLIWGPVWRRYIVAALVEDIDGEKICRELVPKVDNLLKMDLETRTSIQ